MTDIKVTLGGSVVVCCLHGREKRVEMLTHNVHTHKFVNRCLCCENLFASDTQGPQVCVECSPKIIGGESKVG